MHSLTHTHTHTHTHTNRCLLQLPLRALQQHLHQQMVLHPLHGDLISHLPQTHAILCLWGKMGSCVWHVNSSSRCVCVCVCVCVWLCVYCLCTYVYYKCACLSVHVCLRREVRFTGVQVHVHACQLGCMYVRGQHTSWAAYV